MYNQRRDSGQNSSSHSVNSTKFNDNEKFGGPKSFGYKRSREYDDSRMSLARKRRDKFDNNDNAVRQHYNSKPNTSDRQRRTSNIYGVRKFNNFIKSILIDHYSNPYETVLDLCCGKGGDIFKWLHAGIDGLIGVDIAEVSIEHARDRYRNLKIKTFWVDFCVGNAFKEPIEELVHPDAFPVDEVSCQFALHYSFADEASARMALSNVSRALKPGGRFIGTMPDSHHIAQNLSEGKTSWGNSLFKIEFEKPNPTGKFASLYGNKYVFYLSDAVESVPEYVVPWEGFVELAKEYNLKLVICEPFLSFFHNSIKDYEIHRAAQFASIIDGKGNFLIDKEQLEAASIYCAFVFAKYS